jgi:hypothetical protein
MFWALPQSAAFLVFMSVSGAPGFTETMKVFTRERLNGYYSNLTFTLADTLACACQRASRSVPRPPRLHLRFRIPTPGTGLL